MFTNEETQKAAQDVFDFIIEHPELHRQESYFGEVKEDDGIEFVDDTTQWSCNTTMCIAGTALMQKYGGPAAVKKFDADDMGSINEAALMLGLESIREQHTLFLEMNKSIALDKLNALAQGDIEKFNSF